MVAAADEGGGARPFHLRQEKYLSHEIMILMKGNV